VVLRRHRAVGEDTQDLADPGNERLANAYQQTLPDAWPGGIWPDADTPASGHRGWVRVSAWACLGLILGLVALCATLTGLLAPEGLALGLLAILASIAGFVGASRPGITGHSLALLGLLAGLGAAGLAAAAITGHLTWLNSHTDAIPHWHAWLVAHWPWLGRW
jgi:hypothetical protein